MYEIEDNSQDNCLIVHPDLTHIASVKQSQDTARSVAEANGLARAIHLQVLYTHVVKPKRLYAGAFLGRGQRDDIAALIEEHEPMLVIFNGTLSPIQQRNLEVEWDVKVIDRTGLILEIFGERAQTKEGVLQVDLAMLEYQRSRLVRSWTHLERQRGGAGFLGGPGETQIELDRRMIADKIVRLKKEIESVKRTRDLGRASRERVPFPIVALVGYTNAGKSTLFNTLTGAEVMAEDLLFATLDPTMRRLALPGGHDVILADTVGFIADLPTHLVAAFRSTLEQVTYADVILHVIDVSAPDHKAQRADVIAILKDLGIEYESDSRVIEVWNKIDVANSDVRDDVMRAAEANPAGRIGLSALSGEGIDVLLAQVQDIALSAFERFEVRVPAADGKAMAWLYANAQVEASAQDGGDMVFEVLLDEAKQGQFAGVFGYALEKA